MGKSFLQRRHESPDYELEVWITGVDLGVSGRIHWEVLVGGNRNREEVAEILDRAARVLRKL